MSVAALLCFIRRLGLTLPLWLVAGWSAAEAALFFIVADVPISWIAVRRGPKAAALAAVVAAVASVGGAAILWLWFSKAPMGPATLFPLLPGIDGQVLEKARLLYAQGYGAVVAGSFTGIPFKLFVLQAASAHAWPLLLLAPLIRLPRFLLVGVGVGLLSEFLARWLNERTRLVVLVACWVVFYAWYWTVATA